MKSHVRRMSTTVYRDSLCSRKADHFCLFSVDKPFKIPVLQKHHTICVVSRSGISDGSRTEIRHLRSYSFVDRVMGTGTMIDSAGAHAHTISMGRPLSGSKCWYHTFSIDCDWLRYYDFLRRSPCTYDFYGAPTQRI
jgi:hypothetical protein